MKKLILSLIFLLGLISGAFGKECTVYGITRSPQKLDCSFDKLPLYKLRCDQGTYYLNGVKVNQAFHYEVERGPVPLVFKTKKSSLVVEIYSNRHIKALYQDEYRELLGYCR